MLVGDTWREYMTVCNCCDGLVELLWLRGRGKEFPGRWLAKLDHQRFLNNVHLTTIGGPGRPNNYPGGVCGLGYVVGLSQHHGRQGIHKVGRLQIALSC
jgi:hypothetical protein